MHVLNRLREEGRLDPTDAEAVILQAQRAGERIEEALIEIGLFRESSLLKYLASVYRTRFVSTSRLAKADIDRRTLAKVPQRLAERLQAFPVAFDKKTGCLSVVLAAPGEDDAEKQIQVVSGVREVRGYVGRPAAIRCALNKFYRGDPMAFDVLLRDELNATAEPPPASASRLPTPTPPATPREAAVAIPSDDPFSELLGPATPAEGVARPAASPEPAAPAYGEIELTQRPTPISAIDLGPDRSPFPARAHPPTPTALRVRPDATPVQPIPIAEGVLPVESPLTGLPGLPSGSDDLRVDTEAYLETLAAFVSLLERDRDELRGHSGQVARVCRAVAERVGMNAADRHALLVAAYLHDLGKGEGGYHLTALNVARFDGHRRKAQKGREAPLQLLAAAKLPAGVTPILAHLYERWDGQGFPDRLAGKDIPYGARVLSLVETYADLVANPRNPYRKILTVGQSLQVLKELSGQLFDPTLAELLHHTVRKPDGSGLEDRPRVLLVDPDPEDTTVLEMRLLEHGFRVRVTRDLQAAVTAVTDGADIVIAEVDLGGGPDGFDLLRRASGDGGPPFLFVTSRADRATVSKAFDLGAADYLVKPASPEVIATKIGQILEDVARSAGGGFGGSLKEMALPDVVQVLSNGRKTGRLQVVTGSRRGEILFHEGQVFGASFGGEIGEEALYAMLGLREGTFSLDPSVVPTERTIHTSAEGLLLEGMRRLDEGLV